MRRFWTEAAPVEEKGGWSIALDGKPLRTPERLPLRLPTQALAQAIAGEWNAAAASFEPADMPLTGLANAAIDRVSPDRQAFARSLAAYGESDLACYRADAPRELVDRQEQKWDALLAWARRRYDVDFKTTCGIIHVPQPQATTLQLSHAVAALDPFRLTGLSPLVTNGGSLIAALAVLEGAVEPDAAWDAVAIEDHWQLEQWGSDADAEAALENRRRDFFAAAQFLELLDVR